MTVLPSIRSRIPLVDWPGPMGLEIRMFSLWSGVVRPATPMEIDPESYQMPT